METASFFARHISGESNACLLSTLCLVVKAYLGSYVSEDCELIGVTYSLFDPDPVQVTIFEVGDSSSYLYHSYGTVFIYQKNP